MASITLLNGRTFAAETGQSLLNAAQVAGITLPHSCRTGRCSACKSMVKTGSTQTLHDELGLSQAERDAGWILTCTRSALTDVELTIDDLGEVEIYPPRTTPARIQALDLLAPDVLRVMLRLPPATNFQCHPGQYIDVIGPTGARRSYSLAQAARPGQALELHIRRVPGGLLSQYWFEQAKVNDLLRLNGPLGTFFLRDVNDVDLIFLATGTGIAPVKAMLEGLSNGADGQSRAAPRSVAVYWGGRITSDLYWLPESLGHGLSYTPVLSRADESWMGARGHVQQALMQRSKNRDWSRTRVYACGSDAMIQSARHALARVGLNERHFHADAFVCSSAA